MVHGGGRGIGCSLQGTVVCVMLIKDVTDVTEFEETRRGELIHHCVIILTISVRVGGRGDGTKREREREGVRETDRLVVNCYRPHTDQPS